MDYCEKVTAVLINYNGFRNKIKGKGRLQVTLESLMDTVLSFSKIKFLLIDNESSDGSRIFLHNFPIGEKMDFKRLHKGNGWMPTTQNNCSNIYRISQLVKTPYLWFIENDSYFFNKNNFLKKAVEVLDEREDLSIIHLRRFTPLCCKERPGAPQNHCRVESIERLKNGQKFYILEKAKSDCVWVDVGDAIPNNFIPAKKYNFINLCIGDRPGNIRKTKNGWQRYIKDYWNTYTNHGYVVRTKDLKFVMEKYRPQSEREIAMGFKKHFIAARMQEDAFVCFGWKNRVNPTESEILQTFDWVKKHNYSSVLDYGSCKGNSLVIDG